MWASTQPLPTSLVWLPMVAWYAALRPGLMSADSIAVWQQVVDGGWIDMHAPVYTAAMWVSRAVVGDPSLVTLGQSLLLAAAIVALVRAVVRIGAPQPLAVGIAGLVAASPMVGGFAVSLWKDVPYSAALLFVVARIVDLTGQRLAGHGDSRALFRSLAGWLLVALLLRQNGVLFALALVALLWLFVPDRRRSLVLVGTLVIAALLTLKVLVYPVAGIEPSPTLASVALFFHDIAAVAESDPEVFEPEDRVLLDGVAPFETWRTVPPRFGCSSANWQWDPVFHWEAIEGKVGSYVRLWSEAAAERPGRVVANRLCVGAIAFRPDTVGLVYTVGKGIDPNEFGLRTTPVVDGLDDVALDILDWSAGPSVQWLLWRGPVWIYAAWLALAVAARRQRRPALLLPVLPLLALQFSVFVVNPAQDARYMMAGLVAGLLLLPVAAIPRRTAVAGPADAPDAAVREGMEGEGRLESAAVTTST